MSAALELPASPEDASTAVAARARHILDDNNAVQIATLGGAWSPWILGAYFSRVSPALVDDGARTVTADLDLVVMVEANGKTFANLQADPRVAFSVSKNDATCDFLQGSGRAVLLQPEAEVEVMAALTAKMPWFRLYTPCRPVRLEVRDLFVTSFELGWMPARRLALR